MSAFDQESLVSRLAACTPVGRVWVAYSGGLDSTVLLHAAAAVRERLPGPVLAIHLDHGLHPDSRRWTEHCRVTCERLAIPFVSRRLDLSLKPGQSLEAVARDARYRAFSALLAVGDLLLTAHHQDDQAETLLLALIRGSGVQGLAAMPFAADLGLGRLVRPLLDQRRADLEHYARTLGLTWVEDPSNRESSIDRNYLRNQVMPLMRERWPALSATLSRSAGHCAEAAQLVDLAAGRELVGLAGERPGTLSITGLQRLDPALRKAVLRLWLRRQGFRAPDRAHLGRIVDEVLPARPDAAPLVAWPGCEVRRYRQDLFALRPLPPVPPPLEILWEGAVLPLPCGLGALERLSDGQRAGCMGSPTKSLRVRFGGTELVCRARAGAHQRPLKKLYQEAGIPPWLRPYVPFLFDGDDLVEVAGVCRCVPSGGRAEPVPGAEDVARAALVPPASCVRWSGHPWEYLGYFC